MHVMLWRNTLRVQSFDCKPLECVIGNGRFELKPLHAPDRRSLFNGGNLENEDTEAHALACSERLQALAFLLGPKRISHHVL